MTPDVLLAQLAANPASGVAQAPQWGWYVILYFFLGGLSAGSYFIATLLAFGRDERDRDAIQLGYVVAFPLVVVCGLLLIVDLGVPSRFWHMLVRSQQAPALLLKPWSPISIGAWALLVFSAFSFVSFVGALIARGVLKAEWMVRLGARLRSLPGPLAVAWGVAGAFFGFFMAGYTGVLVTGTSLPLWHNARWLGAVFVASAASTSFALLLLLLLRQQVPVDDSALRKLARGDRAALLVEAAAIAALLALLGALARPLVWGGFGVLFWLGVVATGIVVPLSIHRLPAAVARWDARQRTIVGALGILLGGLLLRFVVVMAPQYPRVALWHL